MQDILHAFAHFNPIWIAAIGGALVGYGIAQARNDKRNLTKWTDAWNRGHHFGVDLESSHWEMAGRHDKGYHSLWDRLHTEMARRQHGRVLQTMDDYEKELEAQ